MQKGRFQSTTQDFCTESLEVKTKQNLKPASTPPLGWASAVCPRGFGLSALQTALDKLAPGSLGWLRLSNTFTPQFSSKI